MEITIHNHKKLNPKFLILRFSSIGDIVLTTPVVRCLKQQMPNCTIHYVVKKQYASVLQANPYIDELIEYDGNWDGLISDLKYNNYSYIIDLHHNLRTVGIKQHIKAQSFSFNKLNIRKWLVTSFKINILPNIHIVDRYMATLKSFKIQNDGKGLDFFINPNKELKEDDLPTTHLFGFIALVIGAAHITKQLTVLQLTQLCESINYPIILLGGKEDVEAGNLIAQIDPIKIYNSCGKFSLQESAQIVSKSKLVITHDTGLMHIASAFKKPIISIWGNTIPSFGMTPYYGNTFVPNYMFEVKNLSCRPCSKIGHRKCPKKHFKCMLQQPIAQIAQQAMQMVTT
jgi:heptosyltransferase-2